MESSTVADSRSPASAPTPPTHQAGSSGAPTTGHRTAGSSTLPFTWSLTFCPVLTLKSGLPASTPHHTLTRQQASARSGTAQSPSAISRSSPRPGTPNASEPGSALLSWLKAHGRFPNSTNSLTLFDEWRPRGDPWLQVWGLKFVLDGGLEAGATEEPYLGHDDYCGLLLWPPDALVAAVDRVVRRGWRVEHTPTGTGPCGCLSTCTRRSSTATHGYRPTPSSSNTAAWPPLSSEHEP